MFGELWSLPGSEGTKEVVSGRLRGTFCGEVIWCGYLGGSIAPEGRKESRCWLDMAKSSIKGWESSIASVNEVELLTSFAVVML